MLIFAGSGLIIRFIFSKLINTDKPTRDIEVDNDSAKESLMEHGHSQRNAKKTKVMSNHANALWKLSVGSYVTSIFVITAACLITYSENLWYLDSIATFLFALVITATTFPLFKNCLAELTETTPPEINVPELQLAIRKLDDSSLVQRVFNLNVWKLNGQNCISCHVESTTNHMIAAQKVTDLLE